MDNIIMPNGQLLTTFYYISISDFCQHNFFWGGGA